MNFLPKFTIFSRPKIHFSKKKSKIRRNITKILIFTRSDKNVDIFYLYGSDIVEFPHCFSGLCNCILGAFCIFLNWSIFMYIRTQCPVHCVFVYVHTMIDPHCRSTGMSRKQNSDFLIPTLFFNISSFTSPFFASLKQICACFSTNVYINSLLFDNLHILLLYKLNIHINVYVSEKSFYITFHKSFDQLIIIEIGI